MYFPSSSLLPRQRGNAWGGPTPFPLPFSFPSQPRVETENLPDSSFLFLPFRAVSETTPTRLFPPPSLRRRTWPEDAKKELRGRGWWSLFPSLSPTARGRSPEDPVSALPLPLSPRIKAFRKTLFPFPPSAHIRPLRDSCFFSRDRGFRKGIILPPSPLSFEMEYLLFFFPFYLRGTRGLEEINDP